MNMMSANYLGDDGGSGGHLTSHYFPFYERPNNVGTSVCSPCPLNHHLTLDQFEAIITFKPFSTCTAIRVDMVDEGSKVDDY